jgi:hypothetical protein
MRRWVVSVGMSEAVMGRFPTFPVVPTSLSAGSTCIRLEMQVPTGAVAQAGINASACFLKKNVEAIGCRVAQRLDRSCIIMARIYPDIPAPAPVIYDFQPVGTVGADLYSAAPSHEASRKGRELRRPTNLSRGACVTRGQARSVRNLKFACSCLALGQRPGPQRQRFHNA